VRIIEERGSEILEEFTGRKRKVKPSHMSERACMQTYIHYSSSVNEARRRNDAGTKIR
jgi:hypothetical protein